MKVLDLGNSPNKTGNIMDQIIGRTFYTFENSLTNHELSIALPWAISGAINSLRSRQTDTLKEQL